MLSRLKTPTPHKKKAMTPERRFPESKDILPLILMAYLTLLLSPQQMLLIGLEQLKW